MRIFAHSIFSVQSIVYLACSASNETMDMTENQISVQFAAKLYVHACSVFISVYENGCSPQMKCKFVHSARRERRFANVRCVNAYMTFMYGVGRCRVQL